MFVLFLQTSTNLISGYNWLFVTTDQPYGNIVTWTTEANASRLEPGSFQPVVSATFDRNFSILLNNNKCKIFWQLIQSSEIPNFMPQRKLGISPTCVLIIFLVCTWELPMLGIVPLFYVWA